jgi:hypothetical protein
MFNYDLQPSINGKMRQMCIAEVEIPPEEAKEFFDKTYNLKVGGRLYDDKDSTNFKGLPTQTYQFRIPAANFNFEPLDDKVKSR